MVFLIISLFSRTVSPQSGSGDGIEDEEGDCRTYDRPELPLERENDLRVEIRCHLACIEEVS